LRATSPSVLAIGQISHEALLIAGTVARRVMHDNAAELLPPGCRP
jgi:hypothetical protein